MKILTAAQMREIDRKTIVEIGIPGPVLMENAGLQVVRAIRERFPDPKKETFAVVAGKGNNGGDGLVVARHLLNLGASPLILLLAAKDEVKGDAAVNLRIAEKIGLEVIETPTPERWQANRRDLLRSTVIIDALFGTGLLKPLDGLYARAVADINASRAFKVAVDIPSGLSSDTFKLIGPAVKADLTVALAAPKIAHIFPPAADVVGDLVVAGISMPDFLFEDSGLTLNFVERQDVAAFFRKRKRDTHKGNYGNLLIAAGSWGKTGAAALAGKAALKMGAGLVTVATAESALPVVARTMDELMTEPLPETSDRAISAAAVPRALALLKGRDGFLIGPGLSTQAETAEFAAALLPKLKVPVVIDADGLNILAGRPGLLKTMPRPAVLTPHPGEFARLTGFSTADVLDRRLELAPDFARTHNVYLVLKGYRTLVAAPDGRVFVNPTGNPGMATAGSGDVLSGMIAAQVVQEKDTLGAVLSAVYAHGLCGDYVAEHNGQKSLTAGDLIKVLPRVLKSLE
jgi:NAD(P)H-hydrate epimerase